MRIIVFTQIMRKVSGLQTFERNFIKKMSKKHELTYVYKAGYEFITNEITPYAQVIKDIGQEFECDICIYSSIEHGNPEPKIKAKRYIQVYHADVVTWGVGHKVPKSVDVHVCVGEGVQKSLKENLGIDSVVIPNILGEINLEKVVRFITASRLAEGKGFDRLVKMAKMLKKSGRKFIWEIYGDGSINFIEDLKYKLTGIPDVILMGSRTNIQSYIARSDFLVQLSDNEGFCYSMHEALQVGIPCIVTDWEGARNVIYNGVNGFIVDMELNNLDIDKIYKFERQTIAWTDHKPEDQWEELFKI